MNNAIEKIAIIGAGALGATYGSLLYEMDPESVCFIASGARYERLHRDGVVVNGKHYAPAVVTSGRGDPCRPGDRRRQTLSSRSGHQRNEGMLSAPRRSFSPS